jgi:L-cysteine desulfidase
MPDFIGLLKQEAMLAEGCTEPIAVAYATSVAAEQLSSSTAGITDIHLLLSANIIKNALGVGIPGTGAVGIEIAAALGAIICKPDKKLELLSDFSSEELLCAQKLVSDGVVRVEQKQTGEQLYIEAIIHTDSHESARAIICRDHTNIVRIDHNDELIFDRPVSVDGTRQAGTHLTLENIYEFANTVDPQDISFLLDCVSPNMRISTEGLSGDYGLQVGKRIAAGTSGRSMLLNNLTLRIMAATAAGSDARMAGCPLSVMSVAGSGNQGIACTVPVIELAGVLGSSDEELSRALAISELVVIHLKEYMGRLSPLCGSGIAGGTGACCGLTYLQGGTLKQIKYAVNNMIGMLQGMICDGAKATCALKIAAGTNAAIQCSTLALADSAPSNLDGIIFDDAEDTIKNIGVLVRDGLRHTDETILSIMLTKQLNQG